jgi:endogenous inhibitor of DNA gyrase (YacG/DUF329 family)
MKCPICKKQVAPDAPFHPFCSDRCRIIDLGNWATGKYVIPVPIDPETDLPDSEDEDRET